MQVISLIQKTTIAMCTLKRHSEWTNALVAYYSKLNNTYEDKIWIMRVKPNQIS